MLLIIYLLYLYRARALENFKNLKLDIFILTLSSSCKAIFALETYS